MTQLRQWTSIVGTATATALLAALAGCGGPPKLERPDGREAVIQEDLFDYLWVEPQIIVADSLMTLIRSERIDSIEIDPAEYLRRPKSSIALHVVEPACEVNIVLLDDRLRLVYPLLLKRLSTGYYRLTVNLDRFRKPSLPPGSYFLQAEYCGRLEVARVSIQ